jgi:lipoate-protein ligase A
VIFDELDWWWDEVARPGPEAMAVDEWLLETVERPTLRVYGWDGAWASVGYFGDLEEAKRQIPDRKWVRRRTGGGTVDHADDWTYTVVVPAGESLARMRGGESYRLLHECLAAALVKEGLAVGMAVNAGDLEQSLCFRNPVPHDLLGGGGKLAGAGQRRTRRGLLHQGSVAGRCEGEVSLVRAETFAQCLCKSPVRVEKMPPVGVIAGMVESRFFRES